jgi:hypothetical protein
MDNVSQFIDEYIEDKKYAWSPSTIRSEGPRLKGVAKVLNGDPEALWEAINGYKPYSRVTTWIRVVQYVDWLMEKGKVAQGLNPYRSFRTKNARLFKNTYNPRIPDVTFESARERLRGIQDRSVRSQAETILQSCMRYSESRTFENGRVVGKGGREREVFLKDGRRNYPLRSYSTFRRTLADVGLKPHDLRKIGLNKVVEAGANEFELLQIAGWKSLNTAASYIKAKRSRVEELMKALQTPEIPGAGSQDSSVLR